MPIIRAIVIRILYRKYFKFLIIKKKNVSIGINYDYLQIVLQPNAHLPMMLPGH